MEPDRQDAVNFLMKHFDLINEDPSRASLQFFRPANEPPGVLDRYVAGLSSLRPFVVEDIRCVDARKSENEHGQFISFWIDITVTTAAGRKYGGIPVWWSEDDHRFLVSARLHDWIGR